MIQHSSDTVVAVDVGGTKSAVGLVDRWGQLQAVTAVPTPGREGRDRVLGTIADLIGAAAVAAEAGGQRVLGVGIGTAGTVDVQRGCIVAATDDLAGWAGTDVIGGVRHLVTWTADVPVSVLNDVSAHALGEWWTGAGAGCSSGLLAAVGTGIGGAVIAGARLWPGANGIAGRLGHVAAPEAAGRRCPCGCVGHLEAVAAGPAIARRYQEEAGIEPGVDTRAVVARAEAGDPTAQQVLAAAAGALGRALAGLVAVFDPELVVVGGGMAGAGPCWWDPMEAALRSELLSVQSSLPVEPASLGQGAALIGAARPVWNLLEERR